MAPDVVRVTLDVCSFAPEVIGDGVPDRYVLDPTLADYSNAVTVRLDQLVRNPQPSPVFTQDKTYNLRVDPTAPPSPGDTITQTDLGKTIPVRAFSGYLNRGTDQIKHTLGVTLCFRRGATTSGPEPTAVLSWRDDEGEWSPGVEVGLGEPGDTHPVVVLRSLGTYRRRQWRLDFDGDSEFCLVAASEEFELEEE